MKTPISVNEYRESVDTLDRAIVGLTAKINATTCELLVLVRQFDERGGWLRHNFPNCAEWLAWRCDLSTGAAREKVRVAHALKNLDLIAEGFETGALSYSKVRALDDANRAHRRRSLTLRRNADAGMLTITVEVPIEDGELIDQALTKASSAEPRQVLHVSRLQQHPVP